MVGQNQKPVNPGDDQLSPQQNQSLAKALKILDTFSTERPEWGIRELGRALDVNPTTVYRLVTTFQIAGYLEQNPETLRYRLGPKSIRLADLYTRSNPISSIARRVFEQYQDRFDYNFYFGQLNDFQVIYLSVLDGHSPIKIVVEPGASIALHASAIGKVLLAFQDKSYVDQFLARSMLQEHTVRSITDTDQLRRQLEQIYAQKYAVNDGEYYDEVGAVSVPVLDHTDCVRFGVSLGYPRHLVQEGRVQINELVGLAQEIANEIAPHTGYSFQSLL